MALTRTGVLKGVITALVVLVLAGTALPFIKTDAWWVRIFDFPRFQMSILGFALAIVMITWRRFGRAVLRWPLAGLLFLAVVAHLWQIFPYTPLARKQVLPATAPGPELRVLVANVLEKNRKSKPLIELTRSTSADLIIICEADGWWTRELKVLEPTHPHKILQPQTNTYGMNLYSRFPLHRAEVRFLTDPAVPSMRADVEVNGRMVRLYALHPRPPGLPTEHSQAPEDSGQRDSELALIAREVRHARIPVIVAGDFNDVAWSHTTRLFQRISRLLDPRVGRGLYNTYHARIPLWRFPLDHLFHSDHFRLVNIRRTEAIGSDHFPILVTLRLQEDAAHLQEAPPEKPSDSREAAETIREELHQ